MKVKWVTGKLWCRTELGISKCQPHFHCGPLLPSREWRLQCPDRPPEGAASTCMAPAHFLPVGNNPCFCFPFFVVFVFLLKKALCPVCGGSLFPRSRPVARPCSGHLTMCVVPGRGSHPLLALSFPSLLLPGMNCSSKLLTHTQSEVPLSV